MDLWWLWLKCESESIDDDEMQKFEDHVWVFWKTKSINQLKYSRKMIWLHWDIY